MKVKAILLQTLFIFFSFFQSSSIYQTIATGIASLRFDIRGYDSITVQIEAAYALPSGHLYAANHREDRGK